LATETPVASLGRTVKAAGRGRFLELRQEPRKLAGDRHALGQFAELAVIDEQDQIAGRTPGARRILPRLLDLLCDRPDDRIEGAMHEDVHFDRDVIVNRDASFECLYLQPRNDQSAGQACGASLSRTVRRACRGIPWSNAFGSSCHRFSCVGATPSAVWSWVRSLQETDKAARFCGHGQKSLFGMVKGWRDSVGEQHRGLSPQRRRRESRKHCHTESSSGRQPVPDLLNASSDWNRLAERRGCAILASTRCGEQPAARRPHRCLFFRCASDRPVKLIQERQKTTTFDIQSVRV
jgi:hypothetical protein